jgi:hypothetical protein
MATYTIGTYDSNNQRWTFIPSGVDPKVVGSPVTTTGNSLISKFSLRIAKWNGNGNITWCIWNSAGNLIWNSASVDIGSAQGEGVSPLRDSPAVNIILTAGTYFFGWSKSSLSGVIITQQSDTRGISATGNTALGSISGGKTAQSSRRMVGTVTYTSVTAPGAPTSVSSTPGNGKISVSYAAPNDDGGTGITSYESSTDNSTWSTIKTNPFDVTGTNGTALTVYVRAKNAVDAGSSASTTSTPRTVPGVPTSFSANASTFGQLTLSWAVPASNGGSSVTGYTLRRGTTQIYPTLPATTGTATSFIDTGLSPYTEYSYTVTASNAAGTGAATTALIARTMGGVAKVWNGSIWVTTLPQVWNGAWTPAQARMYDGTGSTEDAKWKHGI